MRRANLAIAVGAILVSVAILYGARQYPVFTRTAPGTGLMPNILGVIGLALGVALLVNTLRTQRSEALDLPDRATLGQIAGAMAGLVLVLVLTPLIGLIVAQTLFMLYMLLGLLRRPIVPSLLTTAVTSGFIYGVFNRWLHVPMPTGPLGF